MTPANNTNVESSTESASWLGRLLKRLKARSDSEHETALNRAVIFVIINVYATIIDTFKDPSTPDLLPEIGPYSLMFALLSLGAFLHMLYRPDECPPRKIALIALDTLCVTYAIHLGGEHFLWLYPILLWISLGNGFRFGIKYLLIAAGMTVSAFAVLVVFSPFWHKYPALSIGCLAGLIILPAYVSVLIRKLSEAKRQAEESNRAKSAFLASISHELRTPLTAIIGLSDLMKSTHLSREQIDMNETIGESGRSLLSLINAILDLSRLEAGRMPKKEQVVDLYRLLHRTVGMLEVPAKSKNVALFLHLPADVPRYINISLKHIEDAIINLASNAVKFTEEGHVLIRAEARPTTGGKVKLRVEIEDTGIGISEHAQERIFERFTQADETIIDKFGGTGLGLATVKQMIEDIGGAVGVSSALGIGSRFWFEIDVTLAENEPARDWREYPVLLVSADPKIGGLLEQLGIAFEQSSFADQARKRLEGIRQEFGVEPIILVDGRTTGSDFGSVANVLGADHPAGTRMRLIAIADSSDDLVADEITNRFASVILRPFECDTISNAMVATAGPAWEMSSSSKASAAKSYEVLLADDNKVNRLVIGKILTQAGHKVDTVENGQLALEAMQAKRFDLALFDLNMPVLNGLEAAKLYSFAALGEEATPIVALTADATPEAEASCLAAGMVACLTKPIEPVKLLATIDRIVKASSKQRTEADSADDMSVDGLVDGTTNSLRTAADDSALDLDSLNDLELLGGKDFVREVAEHFITESSEIFGSLETAVANQDYRAFRDLLHALRSGAANVGAKRVFRYCMAWREISPEEVAVNGDKHLAELGDALAVCSRELLDHCRKDSLDAIVSAHAKLSAATSMQPSRRAS